MAALSGCTPGARSKFAGGGVATGVLAFLRGTQRESRGSTFRVCEWVEQPERVWPWSNLHRAAVTLLAGLHKGVSTHRASVDAIGRGRIEQAGGVDLLQERAELLLAAAAELPRILGPVTRKRKRKMLLMVQD